MEILIKPLFILVSITIFLLLILVILEGIRLSRLEQKIDSIAKDSQKFLKLGLFHLKNKKKKG